VALPRINDGGTGFSSWIRLTPTGEEKEEGRNLAEAGGSGE
jgi:hypothetical protein